MKKKFATLALMILVPFSHAQSIDLKSSEAKQVGYSFGYYIGRSQAESLKNIDLDAFSQGLKAATAGQASSISDEDMARILTQFKRQMEARELAELKKQGDANAKLGQQFLAENAKKSGVQKTSSGLQYQIIKTGTGKKPQKNSQVKVHYEGRLIDGTIFDSSIARDQAVDFRLDQVIQGWTEGLQLMQEGAKYRFFIPAELAYGQIGSGDVIEPNSTLIFEIELLSVQP